MGGVLGTIFRKGIITLAASYFIFLFFNKSYRGFLALAVATVVAIAIIYSNSFISQRFSSEKVELEFAGKWNMAKAGLDLFTKNQYLDGDFKDTIIIFEIIFQTRIGKSMMRIITILLHFQTMV